LATATPAGSSAVESTPDVDWTTTASVDGDYYVLGNPQAPVRLTDFSDFF
jgi:protein-disulfide isomerase